MGCFQKIFASLSLFFLSNHLLGLPYANKLRADKLREPSNAATLPLDYSVWFGAAYSLRN